MNVKLPGRSDIIDQLTIILEERNEQAHWRQHAACKGMNPALFFPDRGQHIQSKQMKQVCAGCPVRTQCLQQCGKYYGGIIGGQTTADRMRNHLIKKSAEQRQLRDHIIRTEPHDIAAHDLGITADSLKRHLQRQKQGTA